MLKAFALAGLGVGFKASVHLPHASSPAQARVMTVRHPCDWLRSYYAEIHRAYLGIPAVDRFFYLPDMSFDEFIRQYLKDIPGGVGAMFVEYGADVCLRIEDAPWCLFEFLESMGVPAAARKSFLSLGPVNVNRRLPRWNPALRDRVVEAERECLQNFDYGRESYGEHPNRNPLLRG